jgi:hypothetical protein
MSNSTPLPGENALTRGHLVASIVPMRATASLLVLILTACALPAGETNTTTSTTAETPSTTSAPTTSTPAGSSTTTAPGPTDLGAPPWSFESLGIEEVPAVLAEQWDQATKRDTCSALYPGDPGVIGPEATVRSANFGEEAWAIAWDLPSGPGRAATGEYCADCGRGAYGIAGTGVIAIGNETEIWPNRLQWSDGSKAGYGLEGHADPDSGAPQLMYLLVRLEGCLYNVWSFLGTDHLLEMVGSLRRVEGLEGRPTRWVSERPEPEVEEFGDPPWISEAPLQPGEVDEVLLTEWTDDAGVPATCPLLAYSDLGSTAADAVPRRATNFGEMLVAWDRPSGPGHAGSGEPCDDCGRGAIGLGTFQFMDDSPHPITHRWADGSVGSRYDGLYGSEMHLRPAGFDCTYWLWSHLGDDHLEVLVDGLRRVLGYP